MSAADALLRLLQTPAIPGTPDRPEAAGMTVIWRMNPRAGVRCPSCGRMFRRVLRLPVRRTCVNCGSAFAMTRDQSGGVHFAQLGCPQEEAVSEQDRLITGWFNTFNEADAQEEAISSSPKLDPFVRHLLDKSLLKMVHRHLTYLGRQLSDKLRQTLYPPERRLIDTFVYKQWVEDFNSSFRDVVHSPYAVRVKDHALTVDNTPGLQFFGGRAGPRTILLTTNGAMSIGSYLQHRHDNFQALLREYFLIIRHEGTHLQQYPRMPQDPRTGLPMAGTQRRQSVPGTHGYLSRPIESAAVANELAELVAQGQDIRQYPRFQRFLTTYGRDHKATKRVLKLTYQILQHEEDPALLKRFAQQVQQLPRSAD